MVAAPVVECASDEHSAGQGCRVFHIPCRNLAQPQLRALRAFSKSASNLTRLLSASGLRRPSLISH